MDRVIRWGIWGTGAIAHSLAADFRLVTGGQLHAVASRTGERARAFAAKHGIPKHYQGLEALLSDAEINVVYIASPNHCHAADALASIERDKAVLLEKPFALNMAEAEFIVNAARQRKVFCMEAMWTRFIPAVAAAKRSIDANTIGAVRLIQGNFAYPMPAQLESRLLSPNGGGALLDRGVYLISLAHYLLGVPQSIGGAACLGATGVDEQSTYQLVYRNGALADFAASLRVRGTNEVVIFGENGLLRLCKPFYKADRLILGSRSAARSGAGQDAAPSSRGVRKLADGLRDVPGAKSLARRIKPLLAVLRPGRVQTFPFAGNGYQFEVEEVNRCLREQRTESTTMPLSDTLDVMRTMDALETQWRVRHSDPPMKTI